MLSCTCFILYLEQPCIDFGGIVNPDTTVCCDSGCGTCGGSGCSGRKGGSSACCVGTIPDTQICGVSGQMAPCRIQGNK